MIGLDQERQRTLYSSGKYVEHLPDWSHGESPAKADGLARLLKEHSIVIESVLDVGCGSGGVLSELVNRVPAITRAIGIDTAEEAIRIANELSSGARLKFECASLDVVDGAFDLVIASHVVEHVTNYGGFIETLRSKGKYVYINIPIEANVFYSSRANAHVKTFNQYGHINFFSEGFFIEFLKSQGCKILAVGYGDEFRLQQRRGAAGVIVHGLRAFVGMFSPSLAMRLLGGWSLQVIINGDLKRAQWSD